MIKLSVYMSPNCSGTGYDPFEYHVGKFADVINALKEAWALGCKDFKMNPAMSEAFFEFTANPGHPSEISIFGPPYFIVDGNVCFGGLEPQFEDEDVIDSFIKLGLNPEKSYGDFEENVLEIFEAVINAQAS